MDVSFLQNKSVVVRADLNVPLTENNIVDDTRIRYFLPTLRQLIQYCNRIILISHLGRPKQYDKRYSLQPIVSRLQELSQQKIQLCQNLDDIHQATQKIVMLENIRFFSEESKNDEEFAKILANLADVYIMDAFSVAHRRHASIYGALKYAKHVITGPLMQKEITNLNKVLQNPKQPLLAIISGAKISTKLPILENIAHKATTIATGGGIANTLLAQKFNIGKSLHENIDIVQIMQNKELQNKLMQPVDVKTTKEIHDKSKCFTTTLAEISQDDIIVDIGPQTIELICAEIKKAQTILWNGPLGIFEIDNFSQGTKKIAQAIANSNAFSVVGGGETVAVINKLKLQNKISYISTAGGAFLAFIAGETLPALKILQQRNILINIFK